MNTQINSRKCAYLNAPTNEIYTVRFLRYLVLFSVGTPQ